MNSNRNSLLRTAVAGALGAALLCGAGVARAQDYYGNPSYGPPPAAAYGPPETVIVHPYYDQIQKQNLLVRYDGEINPTLETISHPVSYSDLDLSRRQDRAELRYRIRDTAENLCATLEEQDAGLTDRDSHRECVRQAVESAMAQVE